MCGPLLAVAKKIIYIYSNTKMVAPFCDADKLKMYAWDNEGA
jgi:hypothetical protein